MSTDYIEDDSGTEGWRDMRDNLKSPSKLLKEQNAKVHVKRRGLGKTGQTRSRMAPIEREAICLLRGRGLSCEEIGVFFKRSKKTIETVISSVERGAKKIGIDYDWKADIKELSIVALRAGLVCPDEPYKRANLGVAGLKGLGEFEGDEGKVNIQTLIHAVPMAQRGRYLTLEPEQQIPQETVEDQKEPE